MKTKKPSLAGLKVGTPEYKAARRAYRKWMHKYDSAYRERVKAEWKRWRQSPGVEKRIRSYMKKRNQTPERRAVQKKYRQSAKGRAAKKKYQQSPEGKAVKKKYGQSPKGRAAMKAALKKQRQIPKWRAYHREFNAKRKAVKKERHDYENPPLSSKEMLEIQDGKCYYCECDITLENMHIEHKTPLSRGGMHSADNVVASCAKCNLQKHTMTAEEYLAGYNTVNVSSKPSY